MRKDGKSGNLASMNFAEIEQRIAIIQSKPGFDVPVLWLTFVLCGLPQRITVG
jgi:hypothetical protein